jgi:hypothetical protein
VAVAVALEEIFRPWTVYELWRAAGFDFNAIYSGLKLKCLIHRACYLFLAELFESVLNWRLRFYLFFTYFFWLLNCNLKKCAESLEQKVCWNKTWSVKHFVGRPRHSPGETWHTGFSNTQVIIFSCAHRIKDYFLILLFFLCKITRFEVSSAVLSSVGCYCVIWYVLLV